MVDVGELTTDFGGVVWVWGCRRCGVLAVTGAGERPVTGGDVSGGRYPDRRL